MCLYYTEAMSRVRHTASRKNFMLALNKQTHGTSGRIPYNITVQSSCWLNPAPGSTTLARYRTKYLEVYGEDPGCLIPAGRGPVENWI